MWRTIFICCSVAMSSRATSVSQSTNQLNWWKTTQIYEVYPRSFKDSDGNGLGDLKGIMSKLDHFSDLGIECLWIDPFYPSPMVDNGYDISNYYDVDPIFGTLQDFRKLVSEMEKRGMKMIIDIVINHSSSEHPWFLKSVKKVEPYTDYYVWKDAKGFNSSGAPIPPNNWLSQFGGSAWEWNADRKQFYYHAFSTKQPDFNLRNVAVKNDLKKMLKFWFDLGVKGLRMDAVIYYYEDIHLRDEPLLVPLNSCSVATYDDFGHNNYTTNLNETYEYLHELRLFIDDVNVEEGGFERIMYVEAYAALDPTMRYYGTADYKIAEFPINVNFSILRDAVNASMADEMIRTWLDFMPPGATPNWAAENHDLYRVGSRISEEYGAIFVTMLMMLPGIVVWYYGEEIGMLNGPIRADQRKDQQHDIFGNRRDPEWTPMQWDDSPNAGFSSSYKTWLPVNPDYWRINVELERRQSNSHYNMFKRLSHLRTTNTSKYGAFQSYIMSAWIYVFTRSLNGQPTYIVILNLGTEYESVYLYPKLKNLSPLLKVEASSMNSQYIAGNTVSSGTDGNPFYMTSQSSLVLSTGFHFP